MNQQQNKLHPNVLAQKIVDLINNLETEKASKFGVFIDYDGYGRYIKDGKKTNIIILPSDVKYQKIRKDFNTMVWFNK